VGVTPERFQRIDRLVSQALARDASERDSFLDRECARDPELRAEVESLLACNDGAGSFLSAPPSQLAAELVTAGELEKTQPARAQEEPEPTNGSTLGRYVVRGKLGRGGMGVVYLADDPELSRRIAIKLVRMEAFGKIDGPDGRGRLLREARAMAQLAHPNVVAVYDVGTFGDQVFIAMEYVEGTTLTEWLAEQKRPWREIVNMFAQTGRGLAAAHAAGILHRDFKPDNVLVGKDRRPRVLDFGLARALLGEPEKRAPEDEPAEADAASPSKLAPLGVALTEPGRLMGTPAYMAPEQLLGQGADERTDQFSFCVSLFHGLYGELPFTGESVEAILAKMKRGRVKDGHKSSDVPGWLRQIVLRGLSFKPQDRFSSMDALLGALVHHPTQPRRRRLVIGSALLFAGLLAVAGSVWRRLVVSDRIHSVAVLPLENLTGDPSQDSSIDRLTDGLTTNLAQVSTVGVISRSSVMKYKKAPRPVNEVGKELDVDALVEGTVERSGQGVRVNLHLVRTATSRQLWAKSYEGELTNAVVLQTDAATDIVTAIESTLTPQQRARLGKERSVKPEVYEAYLKGQHFASTRNEKSVRRAIDYFEQALHDDPTYAPAYVGLADAYFLLSIPVSVLPSKDASLLATDAALKALSLDGSSGEAHGVLGRIKQHLDWDWRAAGREFKQAIELAPNYAMGHRQYSTYLMWIGRLDEALVEAKRAVRLDPLAAHNQQGMADWFDAAKQYDKAIEEYRKSIELDPNDGPLHAHLAFVYEHAGRYQEALAEDQRAFALSGNPWHKVGIAHRLAHLGRTAEAEHMLDEIKEKVKDKPPVIHVAGTYSVLRRKDETFEWLEHAYEAHANQLLRLNKSKDYEWLHNDPRYQDLIRRIGWPQ
jgi:serine/threonine protein kinase/tetratricopeptide (TPR) repeat protein